MAQVDGSWNASLGRKDGKGKPVDAGAKATFKKTVVDKGYMGFIKVCDDARHIAGGGNGRSGGSKQRL